MSRKQISKLFADGHNLASDVETLADETTQRFEELEAANKELENRVGELENIIEELLERNGIDDQPSSSKKNYKILKRARMHNTQNMLTV